MKLCVLTSSFPGQGGPSGNAGMVFSGFADSLRRQGHDVTVITVRYQGGDFSSYAYPVLSFDAKLGGREMVALVPSSPADLVRLARFLLRFQWFVFRMLKRERPDHVLACWAVPNGMFALVAKGFLGIPYTVWSQGSDVWRIGEYPLGPAILKRVCRGANSLFADGFGLAHDLARISGRTCGFMPTTRALDIADYYEVGMNRGVTNFLFAARLDRDKGPDLLLEAWRLLTAERRDIKLYLFGAGVLEGQLHEFVKKHGLGPSVHFGGLAKARDLVSYMRKADCVVIPSRADSIPIIFSEALQCGRPMVVTEVGDTGDLVRKYGLGFVAQKDDPADLKDKLVEFIRHRDKDYRPGIAEAMKIFNIDRSAQTFLDSLQKQ